LKYSFSTWKMPSTGILFSFETSIVCLSILLYIMRIKHINYVRASNNHTAVCIPWLDWTFYLLFCLGFPKNTMFWSCTCCGCTWYNFACMAECENFCYFLNRICKSASYAKLYCSWISEKFLHFAYDSHQNDMCFLWFLQTMSVEVSCLHTCTKENDSQRSKSKSI